MKRISFKGFDVRCKSIGIPMSLLMLVSIVLATQLPRFHATIAVGFILATGSWAYTSLMTRVAKPLKRMEIAARRMALGQADVDLAIRQQDEFGRLAESLRLLAQQSQKTREAMETLKLGQFDARILKQGEPNAQSESLLALHSLVGEIRWLTQQAQEGNFDARSDAGRYHGEYRELIKAINQMMDGIAAPIHEASRVFEAVARRDLRVRMQGAYSGGYAKMKDAVNSAISSLDHGLKQVASHSVGVADGSNQIYCTGQVFAAGAAEQKTTLKTVSDNMEEMSGAVHQNSACAQQGSTLAQIARACSDKGFESMQRMSKAIELIKASSDATAKIVKTIDEIAFQTNLLALNAAVEAARAGDSGKGFAIVAGEVRNLAMRSAEAARNTSDMIEKSTRSAEAGVAINNEVMKNLEEINSQVNLVSSVMIEIASASQQQQKSVDQVIQAIGQLIRMTQQYVTNSGQTAVAAESLSSQAVAMQDLITAFQLSSGAAPRSVSEAETIGPFGLDQKLLAEAIRWDA
jgi:methyl-accepting chemotaxis protein